MSRIDYTTDALLSSIKRKASIPANQNLFTNNDFIEILDNELKTYITPLLMRVKDEHFTSYTDFSVVSGTSSYEIPAKAIGKKLRAICKVDSSGNLSSIQQLPLEDVISGSIYQDGYYIQSDNIVLYPTPNESGTIRMFFYRRPNKLVSTTYAAKILSINTGTNEVTCESVPTTWTTSTLLDCIDQLPSFKINKEGTQATLIAGYVLTLPADVVALLQVNDWIAESGETPLPQIPVELIDLLEQSAIVKCMEAMGDKAGFEMASLKLQKLDSDIIGMICGRVDSSPKKAVSKHGIWNY